MIVNLTQHAPTPAQIAEGVGPVIPEALPLLNFEALPSADDIWSRATALAELVSRHGSEGCAVMIGGAPYFMAALESELVSAGFRPRYAFSQRRCVEEHLPDGTVKKTFVFDHSGWVTVSGG